jgi:hypothetical protein
MRRYRTQEVAGSSPASSTHKIPAHPLRRAVAFALTEWAFYFRSTYLPEEHRLDKLGVTGSSPVPSTSQS